MHTGPKEEYALSCFRDLGLPVGTMGEVESLPPQAESNLGLKKWEDLSALHILAQVMPPTLNFSYYFFSTSFIILGIFFH